METIHHIVLAVLASPVLTLAAARAWVFLSLADIEADHASDALTLEAARTA